MRRQDYKWVRGAGLASSVGVVLAVSTAIGFFLGSWLDDKFGTYPWLTVVLAILGMAAGFAEVFRIVDRISREQ